MEGSAAVAILEFLLGGQIDMALQTLQPIWLQITVIGSRSIIASKLTSSTAPRLGEIGAATAQRRILAEPFADIV